MKVLLALAALASVHTSGAPRASNHLHVTGIHWLHASVASRSVASGGGSTVQQGDGQAGATHQIQVRRGGHKSVARAIIVADLGAEPGYGGNARRIPDGIGSIPPPASVRAPDKREKDKLKTILASPQFHPQVSALDRVQQWAGSVIDRFLRSLNARMVKHPAPFALLGFVALAAVVLLAFMMGTRVLGRITPEAIAPLDAVKGLSAAQAFSQAVQLSDRGEYREALRTLFGATLLRLRELGWLELQVGLTNHEYVRRLQHIEASSSSGLAPISPERVDAFQSLVDEFERAWYGGSPVDAAGYRVAERMSRTVTAQDGRRVA